MQLAVNMLVNVKYGFLMSEMSPDVDMLRSKEAGYTECAVPRRMRRSFPPILEEKENGSSETKRIKIVQKKRRSHRRSRSRLPVLTEHDEC